MKYIGLYIIFSVGLIACYANRPAEIILSEATIVPPLPGQNVAIGFFKLRNTGGPDRLMAAHSNISANVELHSHTKTNGIIQMRRINSIDIPARSELNFQPGGYHLMLFETDLTDTQTQTEITLIFEKVGEKHYLAHIDRAPAHKGH